MSAANRSREQREQQRRELTRSGSSFFGALKSVVTAPLRWLGSASQVEEFEEDKDAAGKRRRLAAEPAESAIGAEGAPTPAKRARRESPEPQPQSSDQWMHASGYLDPPANAFRKQYQPLPQRHFAQSMERASSVNLPLSNSRHSVLVDDIRRTASPFGAPTISRTMSVDPPHRQYQPRPLARDVTMQYMPSIPQRDYSMDIIEEPMRRSPSFRGSLPPTSSLRMRMSTPQIEPSRDSPAPPSLTTLTSNPSFVRAPSQGIETRQRLMPGTTLGNMAEAQRHLFSPSKSRSSLSFRVSQEPTSRAASAEAAQKALYELDAYKTPIIPTRRRKDTTDASALASTSRPSTGPDLFKKKRKFIPLNEEEQHVMNMTGQGKKKKKGKDKEEKTMNDTKPYASRNGLKKLLARRKSGGDPDESFHSEDANEEAFKDGQMDTSTGTTEKENKVHEAAVPELPPQDTFAPRTAEASTQGSSLRIGRTKTSRNHLARPTARPLKKKFSAAFEEDDVDVEDEELDERNKEIEKLNSLQASAPPFQVKADFFAKPPQAPPIEQSAAGTREPPVSSLPFSLGSAAPAASKASEVSPLAAPLAEKPAAPAFSFAAPPKTEPSSTTASTPASSSGSVPNFFSSSPVLAKPISVPAPPTPLFPTPAATPKPDVAPATPKPSASQPAFSFGTPAPIEPVKDPNSPFWVGAAGKSSAEGPASSASTNGHSASSLFAPAKSGESAKPVAGPAFTFEKKDEAPKPAVASPFSFGKPAEPATGGLFGKPAEPSTKAAESAPSPFGQPSTSSTTAGGLFGAAPAQPAAPVGFSFGAPAAKPDEASKPAPFSFGTPAAAVEAPFSFGQPAAASAGAPKPLFGAPASATEAAKPAFGAPLAVEAPKPLFGSAPSADAPKPLFGSGTPSPAPFSFGQPLKADAGSPFSFGAAPSTPPATQEEKKPAFSFGAAPAVPAPAPAVSFGFGSSVAPASSDAPKPFYFGAPAAARPSTPPRNEDNEMRMEESPTREINKAEPSKLTLNTGGSFSFGGGPSGFGSATSNTAPSNPFAFGVPPASAGSNPFGQKDKPEDKPAFGFGPPATSSGFSFGGSKPAETTEPPRPSTTGSFAFGASTPTSTSSSFAFGTPSGGGGASNPFGQASSQAGSAPNSPSTFSQPAPFSFGAPPMQQSGSFSFGSQPASPSVPSLTLPQPGTPSGGFGGFGSAGGFASPTSPFPSAPAPAAGADGGGSNLFTMGSASSNTASAAPPPGGRPVRRLPNRRGAKH